MKDELLSLLKGSRIFSSLDDAAFKRILSMVALVTIKKNGHLFMQGDPSDNVYCLVKGRLGSALTTVSGEMRFIGSIEPGETVGELGALTKEPRSLTVTALKDSTLLKFSAADFVNICHEYPAVMFAILNPIITRSKSMIQMLAAEKKNIRILIVPANEKISLQQFAAQLTAYVEKFRGLLTISDYDSLFKDKSETLIEVNNKISHLAQGKKTAHKYLFILSSCDSPLAKVAFKNVDVVYIASDAQASPSISKFILNKLATREKRLKPKPSLILIHPEGTVAPQNTSAWLQQADFHMYHHLRIGNIKDIQRLVRFIRGKAVGLVLGGGGTRGWAHLGVIKAIRAAKIPIDIIGGTSGGAVVGACYATQLSVNGAYEKFFKLVVSSAHTISWRSLTWPAVSIFNSKNYTNALMDAFGDLLIEDLWMPYFCISTNLATQDEMIHTSGLLWEKNRASSSIPGIIPPMLIDGEMHYDGGLINNLPVDIMRQYVGQKARIIAVDLNNYTEHPKKYNFPPILTFKDILFSKMRLGPHKYKFPRFIDTFLRGIFVGSVLKSRQNSLMANIFISLNLAKYSVLHVNPEQADKLIEIGYREGLKHLHETKVNTDKS